MTAHPFSDDTYLTWLRSALDAYNRDRYRRDLLTLGEDGLTRLYVAGKMDVLEFEGYMGELVRSSLNSEGDA